MAGDLKNKYGSSGQTITVTLASLASSATAGRESTVIDNSSNLYRDAIVTVKVKLQSGTIGNDKAVIVYAYGTVDGGTTYTGNATGSDAAYTMDDPTVLVPIGVIPTPTQSLTYTGTFRVAHAFGGVLPEKWGLFIRNYSGIALSATGSDHAVKYQGVYGSYT